MSREPPPHSLTPISNPSLSASPAPAPSGKSSVVRAEVELHELRDLREQREAMRAEWDTLMAELGNPVLPTEAELERMIRDLPAQERAELRRFHDETQVLKNDFLAAPAQQPPRRTEDPRITRHAIRC